MYDDIVSWLEPLEEVAQSPIWHPEGDALFHTLQVFEHALAETEDAELLAAALLHDVGKAQAGADHDTVGAELIDGHVPDRVVWLVAHHLALLRQPRPTRALLVGTRQLADLERLRRWDLAGRDPEATVRSLEEAASIVAEGLESLVEHG